MGSTGSNNDGEFVQWVYDGAFVDEFVPLVSDGAILRQDVIAAADLQD